MAEGCESTVWGGAGMELRAKKPALLMALIILTPSLSSIAGQHSRMPGTLPSNSTGIVTMSPPSFLALTIAS